MEINFFNKKQIVVVHDIIPLLFPELHKKQFHFFKYILPFALKRIKKIIVPSMHTKNLLIKFYNLDESHIEVIYNGIPINDIKKHSDLKKEDYILFVGRDSATKNLDKLVLAFKEINKKFPHYKLKLVGVNRKFKNKNIESLGFVSDEKLDILYRKAKIFVLPSLYEGFGYPVIEAMSRKTAVACSNVASLPEITGNNAVHFDPYNIRDMVNKISLLISNNNLRNKLEENGYKHSKKFDIMKMLENYEKILNENSINP